MKWIFIILPPIFFTFFVDHSWASLWMIILFVTVETILSWVTLFFIQCIILNIENGQKNVPNPQPRCEYDEDYENDVAMTNLYVNYFLDQDDND